MPDAKLADSLLATAEAMITSRASQAKLRRAVSTSYYSVFHALAKASADALVGSRRAERSNKAWVEVYRGLSHGSCKESCKKAADIEFPEEIRQFADAFVQLQEARHAADYDPVFRLTAAEAEFYVSLAKASIAMLRKVKRLDMVAFASWVLITTRGAQDARKKTKTTRAA